MLICSVAVCAAAFVAAVTVAHPIQALTMQECSVKYKAAQAAGTLKERSGTISERRSAVQTPAQLRRPRLPRTRRPLLLPPHAQRQLRRRRRQRPQAMQCSPPRCHRNTPASPQVRRACTPALINIMPTRRIMPTAGSSGSKKAAATTASATGTLRAEAKKPGGKTEFTGGVDVYIFRHCDDPGIRDLHRRAFAQAPTHPAQPSSTTEMSKPDKRAVSKACSDQANAKNLHGKVRKKFRSECKRSGGKAT